ncbi:cathepsin l [Plakobranchus ocellatus]|uniref:Cathepsin l n=1 Tax=Plakobranchus ocellatus TaxID=259542 RepID=A0AAV3Z690_9GAST|nr:cathepsin l [Plakobranchus ocellatus]
MSDSAVRLFLTFSTIMSDFNRKGGATSSPECVIGALEASWFAFTGRLISLSEQQLIDCVEQADGCHGEHVIRAYQHISKAGGVDTDANYPYRATVSLTTHLVARLTPITVCWLCDTGQKVDKITGLLKNSYGTSWGEDGYILMSRNKGNQCGIATLPVYPKVTQVIHHK